jgi:type I restriction enzyme S subunit
VSELPKGWTWTTLGTIANINMGQSPDGAATNSETRGVPLIGGAADFDGSTLRATRFTESPTKLCSADDLVLCIRATIGKVAIADKEYCLGRGVAGLTVQEAERDYLRYLLNADASKLDEAGTGTTFRQIDKKTLSTWPVPLPPSDEQQRIVVKLTRLFARICSAREELGRIPILIDHYKHEILAAAYSGELTKQWRGKKGLAAPISVQLGSLVTDIRYGTAQRCHREAKGTAVLRIPNVSSGRIDLADLKYAELEPRELTSLQLQVGDILVIRSNGSVGLVGRPALITESEAGLAYAGYLIRLRPNLGHVLPVFLSQILASPQIRKIIEIGARSTSGVHNVNSKELAVLPVPCPCLSEQKEIIRHIESAFAWLDEVAAERKRAAELLPKLNQAILAKAFRGELVPQDPTDEPAAALLNRIRESSQIEVEKKRRRDRSLR